MTDPATLSPMDDIARMFSVDDYLFFYSDFLSPEHSDEETARVATLLEMERGGLRVLDLACGFGRIANRLALLGNRVTGIEYQAGFLELARAEARRMGLLGRRPGAPSAGRGRVEYHQGDMRQIDYEAQFDRVVMVFNSFGYFSDEENFQVLQGIARALKPGGLLGFDIAHRDGVLNDFHPHYVTEIDGDLMINRFSFDVLTGRLRNDRIVIRGGVRKDVPFSIRLYAITELRDLLARAGLTLQAVYEEWNATPLRLDSPSVVVVAKK